MIKSMEERSSEADKMDEIMLPGFRFHPTDEELVGFYLKRKIQQRPLSIELIKQLDIYKYDPWDLPKMATTGEKEWYFYCPRDRKYRNSARPNRVTGAGFWKATGTDRPIYSSEGNKCIGLKKSLVFYKGRAAKGIKTDWMMHEFRLPSLTDSTPSSKRFFDKSTIPPTDSWAICRIFKKTNSTAQRALSQSWVSPLLTEPTTSSSSPSSLLAKATHLGTLPTDSTCMQLNNNYTNCLQQQSSCMANNNFSPPDFSSYKLLNPLLMSTKLSHPQQHLPIPNADLNGNFLFSPLETLAPSRCTVDVSSMLLNMSSSMLGVPNESSIDFAGTTQHENCNNGFLLNNFLPQVMQVNNADNGGEENMTLKHIDEQWDRNRSVGIPFSLPTNLVWDLSSPSPTDQMSSSFATAQCYT